MNIAEKCLARHALSDLADKTAMIFVANDLSHRSFTYRELDELSARFATSLVLRGLVKGDRVLLRLPNTQNFPIAFFGALRGGFIPVPSSPMLTPGEVDYLMKDSGAKLFVDDASFFADLDTLHPLPEIHSAADTDPAYIVYTSGTTGYPKGVLHAHQSLKGRIPAATNWFNFRSESKDRILHSGKFNWTYVLGTAMMDPLYQGKTVVVYEGENSPVRWVELIQQHHCNIFIGVPTIFRQILQKTGANRESVPTLKHAMCAGEHLTDEVLAGWTERFGFPIYEGLGMSECSYYISQRPGDAIKPNSAGKIQPGRHVALLDADLQPVKAGEEGMLCINRSDPGLFIEYWNAKEANEKQFKDGWFLTGDFARVDAEGYLYFLGRRDEIIKSFGYRVSPFEIERVYRDNATIDDVVAFAENIGPEKTLIAMCVLMKTGALFDEQALIAWGKDKLASYKLPKKIYTLDKFPRSANGKVLRGQIPKQLGIDKT